MLDLFFQVQEKVKEAYGFQGPSLASILKPIAASTAGGAVGGGVLGGIAVGATSETPETPDADILRGIGAGALGGAAVGLTGGTVANRKLISNFGKFRPVRKLMRESDKLRQTARNIAKQVDEEPDSGLRQVLKDTAFDYADRANAARRQAVQMGVDLKTKLSSDEEDVRDQVRGRRKYHYLFGKRIGEQESKNIEKTLKKNQPRTESERNIQSIVGARPTPGQIARAGVVGAVGGLGTHAVGSAIEGGERWLPDLSDGIVKGMLRQKQKAVLHPRALLRAAAVGGILSGAVPVTKQLWDIQTAREQPESF